MTCADCDKARAAVAHGGYRSDCQGCTARAIARCLDAFNALHPRGSRQPDDTTKLRELVARLMKQTEPKTARQMVMDWWRHDRTAQGQG